MILRCLLRASERMAAIEGVAPPTRSIVLRAPEGEVGWSLIELQGSIESRNAASSLDDVEFGKLVHEVSLRSCVANMHGK